MFDTVGKRRADDERRIVPLLLSLVMNGSVVGLLFASAHKIEQAVAEVPSPIVYFADAPREESLEPAAAAPAAPSPTRTAAKRATAPVVPAEPRPLEATSDVAPPESGLDDVTGIDLSTTGGGGGAADSTGMGSGGGGVKSVHWSEVAVKSRTKPKMPDAARVLGFTEESCNVRFFIDEKGKPYDIRLEQCPAVFRDSALEAAWQWRFYPMKDGGKPIKAQFVLSILYRLQ